MTSGHVDPARLQGEALRRWYLRTADEIQAERASAARGAYDAFFRRPDRAASSVDNGDPGLAAPALAKTSAARSAASVRSLKQHDDGGNQPFGAMGGGRTRAYVQVEPKSPWFWDYWSPRGCANCHGYTPDTLPPVGGHSPLPPSHSRRSGGAGGSGGSEPRPEKRECALQYARDSTICGRLRHPSDIAICRSTASDRRAYCNKPDGTIGVPHLETKGGRRR